MHATLFARDTTLLTFSFPPNHSSVARHKITSRPTKILF
jgi:hypothetical protein